MKYLRYSFTLLVFTVLSAHAQVQPLPGAELNFNQVMLEHKAVSGASAYCIQITYDLPAINFNQPIQEITDSFNATIVSNLKFGKNYLWRWRSISNNQPGPWQGPYSFSVLNDAYGINQKMRLHVLYNDSALNQGGLILVDELHSIVDREGNLVWFMPTAKSGFRSGVETADLRLTRAGTLTCFGNSNGFEVDLTGRLLWVTPFKMKSNTISQFGDFYSHELRRLPNNNYMVIEQDNKWAKIPAEYHIADIPFLGDTSKWRNVELGDGTKAREMAVGYYMRVDTGGFYLLLNMGAIVEYDKQNNVLWKWRACDYLKDEDLFPINEKLHPAIKDQDPHLNGFSVDDKNEFVYASFRKLDRIVKIEKKTGLVVDSWGAKMKSGEARSGDNLFHKLHAPAIQPNGNIALFDNEDMLNSNIASSVMVISQITGKQSQVIWKYNCVFDSVMSKNKSSRGGNVDLLPNNNFLVCMGGVNRIFEITSNKKIVWNALAEKKYDADSPWQALPLYRSHFTSSLYPCYFTIQTNADTLYNSKSGFILTINNAGTEPDNYTIKVESAKGSYNIKLNSGLIEKRSRAHFTISPSAKTTAGEQINIVVTSVNNPDFERKLQLHCR